MPEIAPPIIGTSENSIDIMSENQMTVKVGIVSARDGLIKVVISESKSPPLLGAKAVRVRLSQSYHLLPTRSHSPARRQASGAKNAPAEDVTVAESGASIKEFPVEEPAPAASAWHSAHVRLPTHSFIRPA